jgi:hypothetical protein
MASEQLPSIPQFQVSTITEQELQRPGVGKLVVKRCMELEAECRIHLSRWDSERREREKIVIEYHRADSDRQVLQTRLDGLSHRHAISQLIWGGLAIDIGLMIDSGRTGNWGTFSLCAAMMLLLGGAEYLVHRPSETAGPTSASVGPSRGT